MQKMPYSKNTWINGDQTRPLNAARLNHMEDGIFEGTDPAAVGALVADIASNPETELNNVILDIAQSVTPAGVYYPFQTDDLGAARPTPPTIAVGQKVLWEYISDTMYPLPSNMAVGDKAEWVENVPLPWSPADLPGLVGWWDAAASGLTDGSAVATRRCRPRGRQVSRGIAESGVDF